ncbi:MAG: HAMP domain-containing histidine kinase, partial [Bacteroidota bacterium]|nr:HAMP domain-containing histidine kinase [Bacteroidota bacterium]
TNRLSRLNQSLILLAKIDNLQFKETEQVDISFIIEHFINNYEELVLAKEITLTKNIKPHVILTMNETLAEILIINLFTNAIKHNNRDGKINIELAEKSLLVSNTGSAPKADPSIYFERFKKDSDSGDSLGLGLSIVLKICETYKFDISYQYEEKLHKMEINFYPA